jgi:hypothetical protein
VCVCVLAPGKEILTLYKPEEKSYS